MQSLPFRTGKTWLADDDLILLDVLFDAGAPMRLLRRDIYPAQWNLGYTHQFSDHELRRRVGWLCERGVLEADFYNSETFVGMTEAGGRLWSAERCPVWERYCTEQYRYPRQGRTLMSVVAVSPQIRDDFLRIWPIYPARRKKATIRNRNLIAWRTFAQLYVGMATYDEESESGGWQDTVDVEWCRERQRLLKEERSWWRCVHELQRFTPNVA